MSGYSGNLHIGDDGLVGELRTAMTDRGEQTFTFTREILFVPWGFIATMEDGRAVEGPCFVMGPAEVKSA